MPSSPFTVKLRCMDIKVLGTSFNVKAYKNDENETASLDEGVIMAVDKINASGNTFRIAPGNNIEFSRVNKHFSVYKTNTSLASMWRKDQLVFSDAPINDILNVLNRKFNVDFVLKDSTLKQITYSIVIDGKMPLEEIMNEFKLISPVTFYRSNGKIVIDRRKN